MVITREFNHFLDMVGSSAKSVENSLDISTWLHRNDSKLVFLVDPDKERLSIVVENTSTRWPISVEATRLEESITLPIKMQKS